MFQAEQKSCIGKILVKTTFESRVFKILAAPSLSTFLTDVGLLYRKLRNRKGGKKDRNSYFPSKIEVRGEYSFCMRKLLCMHVRAQFLSPTVRCLPCCCFRDALVRHRRQLQILAFYNMFSINCIICNDKIKGNQLFKYLSYIFHTSK